MIQPPPPYVLRKLTVADIPAVMAIERLSFPTAKKEAVYVYELTQNRLAHYQALTRQNSSHSDTLLGFAGYWTIADEIHISFIAVHPSSRRRGFGELLLLNILFLALEHKASLVTLEVRRSNEAAQRLYEKYRFAHVGTRRGYYRDTGEDAILMTVMLETAPEHETFLKQCQDSLLQRLGLTP